MWHIHNLYSLYHKLTITAINLMTAEMAGDMTRTGETANAYKMLFGRREG
jgi:hypothetical protein